MSINEKEVIKYFDLVIKSLEDNTRFITRGILSVKNQLVSIIENKSTDSEREFFENLVSAISSFGVVRNFFKSEGVNGWFSLTKEGLKLKELGGFSEYNTFMEKESKKVSSIHNETVYGDKIQDSSFRDFKPIKKQTNAAPINKPEQKSLLKKIYTSPWTIGIALLIIEEVTFKKIYKIIIPYFNNN
jgi:hypothetical protein